MSSVVRAVALSMSAFVSTSCMAGEWDATLSKITQGQAQVLQTFQGPLGLTGLVIGPAPGVPDQGRVLAWGLPQGQIMVGTLYDRHGRNLNEVVMQTYPGVFQNTSGPDERTEAIAKGIAEAANAGTGVKEGTQERTVYIFFDPRCGHCKELHRDIMSMRDEVLKIASIVWMPVALFGEASERLAQSALMGVDAFHAAMEGTETPVPEKDHNKVRASVQANGLFLQMAGKAATPLLVWRDAQNKVHMDYGYRGIEQIKNMLKEMQP